MMTNTEQKSFFVKSITKGKIDLLQLEEKAETDKMEINSKLAYSISKADIKVRLKHGFLFNSSHASPTLRHEFNST